MTTPEELAALLAKATPGEWRSGPYGEVQWSIGGRFAKLGGYFSNEDAAAIVAAVNWCRVSGNLEAARERDALREALAEITGVCEAEFTGPHTETDGDLYSREPDDEPVMAGVEGPPCALTFGVIRRARAALAPRK